MRRSRSPVRQALPATFAVHVAMTALALPATVALASFMRGFSGYVGPAEVPVDVLPELVRGLRMGRQIPGVGWLAGATAVLLLAGPFLQLAWLHALAGASLRRALHQAARRYVAALGVSLVFAGGTALLLLAASSLPWMGHLAFSNHPNVRLHDLVVAALAVPMLAVLWWAACAHDFGRAGLVDASVGPLGAAAQALRALRSVAPLAYAGYVSVQVLLLGSAAWLGGTVDGSAPLVLAAAAGSQALAFGRTLTRSAWLARCLAHVAVPHSPSGTPIPFTNLSLDSERG